MNGLHRAQSKKRGKHMTEKELLYRLTHTSLGQLIEHQQANVETRVKLSDDLTKLYDKLIPYLIDKSNVSELLDIIIEGEQVKLTPPNPTNQYIESYESKTLNHTVINGAQVEPHRLGRYNRTTIMDVDAYTQDELESLLPQMVEAYPLAMVSAIVNSPLIERTGVGPAIDDYIQKHYIAPLKEAMPNIGVEYKINDVVVFELDPTNLRDAEKASLAKGDYITYKIQLKG